MREPGEIAPPRLNSPGKSGLAEGGGLAWFRRKEFPLITVSKLEKRYGELVAVSDVSFEIEQGEIVGLLGHNGAGKTTIMKILTGYLEPTQGTVTVGGLDVTEDRLGVQKQIGYLPENAPLYPEMLVQEYLLMMAELRGIPEAQRIVRVSEAVRATGLEDHLVQTIGTLSKGYRQRVGLAQAILHRPTVLILDEPTNGLDPVQILEIRELIHRLAEHTTIVLSTHIMQEIEAVCDRVIILINGEVSTDTGLASLLQSNVVRVELGEDATQVEETLKKVEGVERIEKPPGEIGNSYRVFCHDDAKPAPEIIQAGMEAGWKIQGVSPERTSLETVFRDLMFEHIRRVKEGGSEATEEAKA
jgi:ABC-2 type transport system ATP-binding protein